MPFHLDSNFNLWHFFVRGLNFSPSNFALNGQEISPTQDVKVVLLLFYFISRPWIKVKWKRLVSCHKYFAFEHKDVWSQVVQTIILQHFVYFWIGFWHWMQNFCNLSTLWFSIFPGCICWPFIPCKQDFQKQMMSTLCKLLFNFFNARLRM